MSFRGFICPPNALTAGDRNPIEHCVLTCPHKCAAPGLLMSIYQERQKNHHVGTYISASMLAGGGCARQVVFERMYDFWYEPKKAFWPFRGTIAHRCVEDGSAELRQLGWLSEMRMAVDFAYPGVAAPVLDDAGNFTGDFDSDRDLVITVGGTTDNYNPLTRELWDYKSCADTKAKMMIMGDKPGTFSPNLDDAWVWQLNIYRLLVSKTPIPNDLRDEFGLDGDYFPAPESLGIQAISMMEIPRTGASYHYRVRRGFEKDFDIEPLPVLPLDQVEQFVREQALQWYRGLVLGQLPPVVPKSKDWLCQSCAFNGHVFPDGPCLPEHERETQTQESE